MRERIPIRPGDLIRSPDRPTARWHRVIRVGRRKDGSRYITLRRARWGRLLGLGCRLLQDSAKDSPPKTVNGYSAPLLPPLLPGKWAFGSVQFSQYGEVLGPDFGVTFAVVEPDDCLVGVGQTGPPFNMAQVNMQ